jgi:hypothetical protein
MIVRVFSGSNGPGRGAISSVRQRNLPAHAIIVGALDREATGQPVARSSSTMPSTLPSQTESTPCRVAFWSLPIFPQPP